MRTRLTTRGLRLARQSAAVLAIAAGLVAALETGLALCGVDPVLVDEDPYVGFSGRLPLFVEERDASGNPTPYMVTSEPKLDLFNEQRFLRKKGENTYRVFCVGGSTTYGRPYNHKTAFGGWLQAMLPEADPSRNWEVINAGGISYASYRVALLMEELVQYQPDLFIVYSGHNEFLERRSYPHFAEASRGAMALGTALRGLRSYAVAREVRAKLSGLPPQSTGTEEVLTPEVKAILDWANGPWEYQRDDPRRDKVLAHYELNLCRMAGIARKAGAEIMFATTPVNLRGCSPFKSTHRDAFYGDDRIAWERFVEQAGEARSLGQMQQALDALDAAARIDDRYARLHFQRGEVLWAMGRFGEARAAFERALAEDVCPLRALTPMRDIVQRVAEDTGAMLVDFWGWAEREAEYGTPGEDLFLDHVHPTIEAHRQLALMMLDALGERGIVRGSPDWGPDRVSRVRDALLGTLGPRDHSDAHRNLARVLRWGGKFDEAEAHMRRGIELDPMEAEVFYLKGEDKAREGHPDEAESFYLSAILLDSGFGRAYVSLGDLMMEREEPLLALGYYCRALEVQPGHVLAYGSVGRAQYTLGRYEDAIQTYEHALRLMPEWPAALVNLGLCHSALKDFGRAENRYRQALRIDYDFAPAHDNLASLKFVQGDWVEATRHYAHVCRLLPEFEAARTKLALARRQAEMAGELR